MLCEKCGGEINISAGRCIKCGEYLDDGSAIRVLRGINELAEEYADKSEVQEEEVPELLSRGTFVRTEQVQENKPEIKYNGPSLGMSEYMRLMGESVEENTGAETDGQDISEDEPTAEAQTDETLPKLLQKGAVASVYEKADKLFSPISKRVLEAYHKRVPELKRVQHNSIWERIAVMVGCVALIAVIVMAVIWISSSIAPSVKGEWLIREMSDGEQLTWEFTAGGEVYVRAYENGESYVYQTGEYKKQRKNSHNMLTITYEDGKVTRLYYEIDKDTGTFTNVDSNKTAVYERIK